LGHIIPQLIINQQGLSVSAAYAGAENERLEAVLPVLPCQVAPPFGYLLGQGDRSRGIDPNKCLLYYIYMGVSENSVPLNPMVNDHYPY